MKAQFLKPVNITFLPKICLNKPMHAGNYFDTIGPVTKEKKIYTNATINLKTNSLLPQYLLWVTGNIDYNKQFLDNARSVGAFQISEFNSSLKD